MKFSERSQVYRLRRARRVPSLDAVSLDSTWLEADVARVEKFHPRSSDHRPTTLVRAMYDDAGLYVRFDVTDRYVKCVHNKFQDFVSRDSCVEFFVEPRPGCGYFNFEINCGGAMLLYYIRDPQRTKTALFADYSILSPEQGQCVRICHSLPKVVPEEIADEVAWRIAYFVPLALLEQFAGALGNLDGQVWRGNFFKCGDQTSHPHWASWSDIGPTLRFHQPDRFATLRFGD